MALVARLGRLFRGFLGLFISGLEERNPEALMEAARQEFRNKMAQYNMALAQMAGVAERLKNQIKNKTGRAQELERRILANHQAGNLELAGTLARELQELKADLTTDTNELQETENAYQANLRQARVSQREFEDKGKLHFGLSLPGQGQHADVLLSRECIHSDQTGGQPIRAGWPFGEKPPSRWRYSGSGKSLSSTQCSPAPSAI